MSARQVESFSKRPPFCGGGFFLATDEHGGDTDEISVPQHCSSPSVFNPCSSVANFSRCALRPSVPSIPRSSAQQAFPPQQPPPLLLPPFAFSGSPCASQ